MRGYGILRPQGSPCPACGAPIERRTASSDPSETMMRCTACGWTGFYRPPGRAPVEGTAAQTAEDVGWLLGAARRQAEIIEFRPRKG